tara:strand:+ start:627 stop:815 length:189 start_codon:yes stop_codon:yes gene_type:complete
MIGGGFGYPHLKRGNMDNRYFKKQDGSVFEFDRSRHNLESLKNRFEECDADGKFKKKQKKAK